MRRFSFQKKTASTAGVDPVTPWESVEKGPPPEKDPAPQSTPTAAFPRRMFGRSGLYGLKASDSPESPRSSVDVGEMRPSPKGPPEMARSNALRLQKRAEVLNKNANVHMTPGSQQAAQGRDEQQQQQRTPMENTSPVLQQSLMQPHPHVPPQSPVQVQRQPQMQHYAQQPQSPSTPLHRPLTLHANQLQDQGYAQQQFTQHHSPAPHSPQPISPPFSETQHQTQYPAQSPNQHSMVHVIHCMCSHSHPNTLPPQNQYPYGYQHSMYPPAELEGTTSAPIYELEGDYPPLSPAVKLEGEDSLASPVAKLQDGHPSVQLVAKAESDQLPLPSATKSEGDQQRLSTIPELEGDTTDKILTAVPAKVVPASTAKVVTIKPPKRTSQRLFPFIRPDKLHYSVECSSAAEEVARAARDAKDKEMFIMYMNNARRSSGLPPYEVDEELSAHAQQHSDNIPNPKADSRMILPSMPAFYQKTPRTDDPLIEVFTMVPSPLDSTKTVARIVSEPNCGAMTVVERWYGGKYRAHVMVQGSDWEGHPENCPCRLFKVYQTIVDRSYTKIGIGKSVENGGGMWVMELSD